MPCFSVTDSVDVLLIQRSVQRYSDEVGFDQREAQELAIAATELASNILKYGESGELCAARIMDNGQVGLELIAKDRGPPFRNLESALKDGWDDDGPIDPLTFLSRAGIGGGLGAVLRFTDSFRVDTLELGKQIVARRYLKAHAQRRC